MAASRGFGEEGFTTLGSMSDRRMPLSRELNMLWTVAGLYNRMTYDRTTCTSQSPQPIPIDLRRGFHPEVICLSFTLPWSYTKTMTLPTPLYAVH